MNKIYKLKYDRRRNQLVAVSELTTGAGKEATGSVAGLQGVSTFRRLMGTLTPLAVLTGLVIGMLPGLALANPDLPVGGQVVAGQGSISTSGNQMTIHQGTHGLVTNWNSFDIGQNHTVQFVQPDSSAVALNRVTGGHESQILGTLTANGQVMLVNPAGVMFGKGARVNTAGLLASTKNISTEDFMAGRYTFSGGSHPGAEIVNQGSLTTTKGGYIVLAADRVRNSGSITTPSGKTVLAAADRVTLQLDNTGLASVSVNGSVVNALVENSGLIAATNGQVYLTARGKEMLLNTVVNNSGTVEARGLNQRGGEIVLDGGESGVVSQSGMLLADSETGRGGKITVQGANIHLAGGSRTSATGRTGGGEVYVGGGWQGKDAAIRNASKVVMDRDAVIDVSATEKGDGGKAVLWSEDYTNFRGRILAKGGAQSGNGGQVETSSHHNLQAFGDVEASALNGRSGNWLLDPEDISIVSGSTDTNITEGGGNNGIFSPDSSGSKVSNGTINARLNNGTSVTIKTTGESQSSGSDSASSPWGNITVNADINHSVENNVSLTLAADGNINITGHNITSGQGKLDVNLLGGGSHSGIISLNHANITTNGGNITLGQLNHTESSTTALTVKVANGSVLNASGASGSASGNISISTFNPNVDLFESSLNATVRNGGALLEVNNSTLTGGDISLTGTQSGANGKSLPVFLTNATLVAGGDISLQGNNSADSAPAQLELRYKNTLTAGGNITVSSTKGGVFLNGSSATNNISLSAGRNITVQGQNETAGFKDGVNISKATLTSSSGNVTVNGSTAASTGRGISLVSSAISSGTDNNVTLTADNATLSSTNLKGGNITVSAAGSHGDALVITGGLMDAATNLTVTGETSGTGYGIHAYGSANFSAGNMVALTGKAINGGTDGAFNSGGILVHAPEVVIEGVSGAAGTSSNHASGLKIDVITDNYDGGNLTLNGTAQGAGATGVILTSASTNGTGNLTVNGNSASGLGVALNASHLSGGNVAVTGTTASGNKGMEVKGGSVLNATGNLTLTGTKTNGGDGYGIHIFGGNSLTAGDTITLSGTAMDGKDGALNVDTNTFSAQNTVLTGISQRNNIGVKAGGNISVTKGNLSVSGTANRTNSASNVTGLILTRNLVIDVQNGSLNITGNVNDTGHNATSANTSVALNLSAVNLTASNGSVSLNADMNGSTAGNAMILSGGNITAGENIALNGTVTGGTGSGVSLSGTSMTASSGNISVNGTGVDSNNGALHLTGNNNFSAQNTTLSGNAGRNNIGTLLSGNLNVTAGNLSVAGVTHHFNNDANNAYRGLKADGLALDVSNGDLTLSGQSLAYDGVGPQTGGTAGLELINSTLKADHAAVSGSSVDSGSGFILNNVTLNGGIAQGNNMTFSSNGSAANITNTLNVNGGLGYGAFESLQKAGIDNNTSIGALTASLEDMKKYMNFSDTSDWEFNADSLNTSAAAGKAGSWSVTGLAGINASTSGNISLTGLNLTDSNLTGSSLTLKGANNASLTLQNTDLNATSGNVSLSANVANGNALVLSGGNITAGENISLSGSSVAGTGVTLNGATLTGGNVAVSGNVSSGTGAGVSLNNVTVSATSGNITVSGKGYDSGNGSLSVTGNNTFSAQNTVLRGEAGRNNIGVLLGGNLNVTQGNLSVTGVMNKFSTDYYNNFRPLKADGLALNISDGSLSLAGNAVEYDGVGPQGGGTVALELLNSSLKANHADLSGLNVDSGSGFILNNVTLSGGIAQGNNMTFSSEGSAVNVTNALNINGGLGYGVLVSLEKTGTDNNTSVGLIAVSQDDLEHYMNFSADTDWSFDAGSLNGATGDKAGNWTVGAFTGINATTKGNISLTGVNLKNSNLTGDSVTLQGANNASLTLQNTNLTATSGNVSLSANVANGSALVLSGGNITAGENINLNGTATGGTGSGVSLTGVSMTASSGNISVNGTGFDANNGALHVSGGNFSAQNTVMEGTAGRNNTGTQLSGSINVTGGNLTVSGTTTRVNNVTDVRGIDARNTNINVSGTNASLNMTGTVNGDEDATQAPSVVGLDLSGTTTLNATRANLTGVSTAKGMGFILNASLSDSLKSTTGSNLTLSSDGSDSAVHNYIGNRVDGTLIKHLIDSNVSPGSKTEVQQVNIYKQELTDFINATTGNDLTKDFGDWILSFNGINITKSGDINITGAGFSNSTLKAGGNLTLDTGPGNLSLSGSNLTSTNGYVNLTGGSGIDLTHGNISAKNDITINASHGGVTISGTNDSSGMANVTSTSGNISIYGNATGRHSSGVEPANNGVYLTNASLIAKQGNIDIEGDTDSEGGTISWYGTIGAGGVFLSGTVNFDSTSNKVYGHSSHSMSWASGGLIVDAGIFNFTGDTVINGVDENGYGVFYTTKYGVANFNFRSGSHYSFNGAGVVGTYNDVYTAHHTNINIEGGTLDISGEGTRGSGFSGNDYSTFNTGYLFSGNGDVNVKGSSESGIGVDSRYLNNTGLNGNFTVTGESQSGTGVAITYNTEWNVQNATITGTSGSGTGINISGNILHVTNVTLNGTSGGNGDGVQLTGGNDYIIDGVTVTGQSQDGSGVNIGGTLNTINTSITGNASGNGSGVSLHGNVTGDAKENNIITGHSAQGSGLLVSGNSTATSVTLSGDTVDGNGIKVTGNLAANNVVGYGNAAGGGNGLNLAGNVSGGEWHGDAVNGTGVNVTGSSTLTNVSLSGTTEYGTGINVPGNLTSAGTTTVTGNATGNGTGAAVSGTLSGDIYGSSTSGTGAVVSDGADLTHGSVTGTTNGTGDGVNLSGHVTGGVVTGHADNGTGVNISGNSTLTNVSVNGSTLHGTGVNVSGNLTNTGNTDVSGNASAGGTGVHINQGSNVTGGSLSGTSVSGLAVVIDGNNTLTGTTVNGSSGSGNGLVLTGTVNNNGSTLNGLSGSGDGVNLNGTVTGGNLNAYSGSGVGLHITGDTWLKYVNTTYRSDTGIPLLIDGLLSFVGGTLNGVPQGDQAAERHHLWLLQPPREQTSGPEQLMRTAGWQARDVPVGVDICTDGEETVPCRRLDAGMRDRPSHP
ncbi:TPA: filamentous hemagglutinin N-terminal domain-containing protein [Salmonella enterica subsp. enterica serovar Virchow]